MMWGAKEKYYERESTPNLSVLLYNKEMHAFISTSSSKEQKDPKKERKIQNQGSRTGADDLPEITSLSLNSKLSLSDHLLYPPK